MNSRGEISSVQTTRHRPSKAVTSSIEKAAKKTVSRRHASVQLQQKPPLVIKRRLTAVEANSEAANLTVKAASTRRRRSVAPAASRASLPQGICVEIRISIQMTEFD